MKQSDDQLTQRIWDYMEVQTPLAHADVIIVGGSKDINTAAYAAELYNLGFAPLIVFSGYQRPDMDTTEADQLASVARNYGVPESAILREPAAMNTGQNITLSQALLVEKGIVPSTVILVHKPYMARRFLATAQAQWIGTTPVFISRHEPISLAEYSIKHGRGETIQRILGDFQRMRPYAKKGYQSPQDIPADVQDAYDTMIWRGHKSR